MLIDGVLIQQDLEDILQELQKQLHQQNIPLLSKIKPTGANVMVTCPYHKGGQERKPSAGLKKSDGTFHCLACGEVHTLPEFIANCFGYSNADTGWQWLKKHFISVSVVDRKPLSLDISRERVRKATEYVSDEELDSYRYIHPYMYKRGLTDEIIELFDIGYDNASDCITFPVRDITGKCLFVARRSTKTKYFNYPSGASKPIYGIYELSLHPSSEVIVCESMLDALVCWVWGRPAVALNCLGYDLQFKQLRQLPCRTLILATDNDEKGRQARDTIRSRVRGKLIKQFDYSTYPEGKKDMNDLTAEEFSALREIF